MLVPSVVPRLLNFPEAQAIPKSNTSGGALFPSRNAEAAPGLGTLKVLSSWGTKIALIHFGNFHKWKLQPGGMAVMISAMCQKIFSTETSSSPPPWCNNIPVL
eukprot:1356702-Amphidinium_carterae.1